jgi:hypothetical protein
MEQENAKNVGALTEEGRPAAGKEKQKEKEKEKTTQKYRGDTRNATVVDGCCEEDCVANAPGQGFCKLATT